MDARGLGIMHIEALYLLNPAKAAVPGQQSLRGALGDFLLTLLARLPVIERRQKHTCTSDLD